MADSRPEVRYMVTLLIGIEAFTSAPILTDVEWPLDEDRAKQCQALEYWILADPDDEIDRDIYDSRVAEERKWSRLYDRRRNHD